MSMLSTLLSNTAGEPKRHTALALTWLLVLQPALASAGEIVGAGTGDQRPDVIASDNGTPVVNIANPNSKGLSHNLYQQFNVGERGVILNNSRQVTTTEQAGYIEGNPNLRNGSAGVILNEVINANPSQLRGYLEVGGRKADVIVANPWGITCDGCGFINTSRATLTTGVPELHNGMVQGYAVDGGIVRVDGDGLNADNLDRFDVIARSVELNARLRGQTLNIVTGAQDVVADDLAVSDVRDPGGKPQFAISSSSLGGIYGDRIRLIANEQGVGVNLEAPVAAQNGYITISANGDIRHDALQAVGNVSIDAEGQSVASAGRTFAEGNLHMDAGRLLNAGELFAGNKLAITADAVSNRGMLGGREGVSLEVGTSLVNGWSGAALPDAGAGIFSNRDISLHAPSITNLHGDIYTLGDLTLAGRSGGTADLLENRSGLIEAKGDISIQADRIANLRDQLEVEEKLTQGWIDHTCHECSGDHFSMTYEVTEVFVNEVMADSGGSHLVSGGDLLLSGTSLKNEASNILSYGNMTLDVDSIENLGVTTGPFERVSKYGSHMTDGHHIDNVIYGVMPYNRRNLDGTASYWGVGADKDLEMMSINHDGDNPDYDPDNLIARKDNRIHKQNDHQWTEDRTIEGKTKLLGANIVSGEDLDTGDADITNSELGQVIEGDVGGVGVDSVVSVAESGAAQSQYDDLVNGALFRYTNADHPYLVETNPFFTSREGFYGSEYLLRNLGWDPDGTLRLLGDGFFEQKLIREQILRDTGRVFLDEKFADANEQYKALLDQGIHAAEQIGLAIGVALSPTQINRLNEDIVWMVEKEVAGETVLAPQLYLSPNSMTTDNNGSLIAAQGDLTNQGGSIVNAGSIEADDNMRLDLNGGGLRNLGGSITAGERLQVSSESDILNLSGRMQADMLDLSARGDITNRRFTLREENGIAGAEAWRTRYADAALMEGTEGFSLDADGDITISGSEVKGGEGEIRAGGDVNIETVALNSGRKGYYYGGKLDQSEIRHLGSTLSSTLDLLVKAEKDLNIIGSDVEGGKNIALSAGRDLNVLAAADSSRFDFRARHDGETSIRIRNATTLRSSGVQAGENLSLDSGRDMDVEASRLAADNRLSLAAEGDMSITDGTNSRYSYTYTEDDDSFGRGSTHVSESENQSVVAAELDAGGDLFINGTRDRYGNLVGDADAEGDVIITAGHIEAGGDAFVASGGELVLNSAPNIESRSRHESREGTTSSRQSGSSSFSATFQGSTINTGGDLQLMALDGITLENADLDPTGNLALTSGMYLADDGSLSINEDAGLIVGDVQDLHRHDSYSESSKVDLGGVVAGIAALGFGGSLATFNPYEFADVAKVTVSQGLAQGKEGYTKASGSFEALSSGSELSAGGHLVIQSAGDMTLEGATIKGLRINDEGKYESVGGTMISAGTLTNLSTGEQVLDNEESRLIIAGGRNRSSSYFEREEFDVDYLGTAGAALTSLAGSASSAITGDFSTSTDLPDDIGREIQGVERRSESTWLTDSVIEDDMRLAFRTGDDLITRAASLSAKQMLFDVGGDIEFGAALEETSSFEASYSSKFDDVVGGFDRGRLYAGIEGERKRTETREASGTVHGSDVTAGHITFDVDGDVAFVGSTLNAGGADADIGGDMVFLEAEEYSRRTRSETQETMTLTAGVGNSYVDAGYAADDFVKASEDLKRAYDELEAARKNPLIEDLSDYEANVTLALLQQQAVGLQAATATSGAIENAPAFGFYSDVQLATETSTSTSVSEATTSRGSHAWIGEGGMTLSGEALELSGSTLEIMDGGNLNLDVNEFRVNASENHYSSRSSRESNSTTVTLASSSRSKLAESAALNALNAGLGASESEQQSTRTHKKNSLVNVSGSLNLDVEGKTEITGGYVTANRLAGETGQLNIASVQNTSQSSHESESYNFGGGNGGSVNAGYNTASGESRRAWIDQLSGLHGRESFDVAVAGHTQLDGGIIASDDPSEFRFTTEAFGYSDIENYDYSRNSGWGLSTSFNPVIPPDANRAPEGSTTITANRAGLEKEGVTQATVGQGRFAVLHSSDASSVVNRSMEEVEKITKNELTGGLDAKLTFDHRLATEAGRNEIWVDVLTTVGLPVDMVTTTRKILGERELKEVGLIFHEQGLTRKVVNEIAQLPRYEALKRFLSEKTGLTGDALVDKLHNLLASIGSVAADSEQEAGEAIRLFANVGDKGKELGLKDGGRIKTSLHREVGLALKGLDGADAAATNEALMPVIVMLANGSEERMRALSRVIGGASSGSAQGAWVAEQATKYNRQLHQGEVVAIKQYAETYADLYESKTGEDITIEKAVSSLLLEAMRKVDKTYSENIVENKIAARFLDNVSEISGDRIESSTGEETGLFVASGGDYFDYSVNAAELWNIEEGAYPGSEGEKYLVRNSLLDGYAPYIVRDGAYDAYSDTYEFMKGYSSDQQAAQAAEVFLTLPSLAFGVDKYQKLYKASKYVAYGALGTTIAGVINDGPSGAFGALFGYSEIVYGGGKCFTKMTTCWVTMPLAFDGINNTYKAVFTDEDTRGSEKSVYSAISTRIFGDSLPGKRIDEVTDLVGFGKNAAVGVFQPKNADDWVEFLLSSGFGARDSYGIISQSWQNGEDHPEKLVLDEE